MERIRDIEKLVGLASYRIRDCLDRHGVDTFPLMCTFLVAGKDAQGTVSLITANHERLSKATGKVVLGALQAPDLREHGFRHLGDIDGFRVYSHRATDVGWATLIPIAVIFANAHDVRKTDGGTEYDIFALLIEVFLDAIRSSLSYEEPSMAFLEIDDASLLKRVGSILMLRAASPASIDFFDEVNSIALSPYEGHSATGVLAIRSQCHICFLKPVPLNQRRQTRKLIAACSAEFTACTDGQYIYGYHSRDDLPCDPPEDRSSRFEVRFLGRHDWALVRGNKVLMRVVRGLPDIPRTVPLTKRLKAGLVAVFGPRTKADVPALQAIIDTASSAQHGSVVVIFESQDECTAESARLGATQTHPFRITSEEVKHLTRVDGAIIVDGNAVCHAIGAILDGSADPNKQDPARGARYNSALRYVQERKAVVVVISEDGGVDILPETSASSCTAPRARQPR